MNDRSQAPIDRGPRSPPEPPALPQGYRALKVLRASDTRPVVAAIDEASGVEVVLKFAPPGEGAREFHLRSALSHPLLVPALALDRGPAGHSILVSPRVRGAPITEVAGRDRATFLSLASDLFRVLDYLHGEGILHRDLKPDAVRVVEKAKVVELRLLDLDLASGRVDGGVVGGTGCFAAPEALRGLATDERSDLFSAGLLLWMALLDQHPFPATDATTYLSLLDAGPPPLPPSSFAEGFLSLLTALVSPAPGSRPGSAAEAFAILRTLAREPAHLHTPADLASRAARPAFTGRRHDVERIDAALAEGAGVVRLTGPHGIGTTRLLEEIARDRARRGLPFGWVDATKPAPAALARVHRMLTGEELGSPPGTGGREERVTLHRALDRLARLDERPFVLVDDTELLGPPVSTWVELLRQRILSPDDPLSADLVIVRGEAVAGERVMEVGALGLDDVRRCLGRTFPGLDAETRLAKRLHRASQGMPSVLSRALSTVVRIGGVVPAGSRVGLDEDALEALESRIPSRGTLALSALPVGERRVASALIVSRRPLGPSLLGRALGRSGPEIERLLGALRARGLPIARDERGGVFVPRGVAAPYEKRVPLVTFENLCARLASECQDPVEAMFLRLRGGEREGISSELDRVLALLAKEERHAEAEGLLALYLAGKVPKAERARRLEQRTVHLWTGGNATGAEACLLEIGPVTRAESTPTLWIRALIENQRGRFEASLDLTRKLLRRRASEPSRAEVQELLARNLLFLGRPDEAIDFLEPTPTDPLGTLDSAEVRLALTRERCLREMGRNEGSLRRLLALRRASRTAPIAPEVAYRIGIASQDLGRTHRAVSWLQRAAGEFLSRGDRYRAAETENSLGLVLHEAGDRPAAHAAFVRAAARLAAEGERHAEAVVRLNLASLELSRLRFDQAASALEPCEAVFGGAESKVLASKARALALGIAFWSGKATPEEVLAQAERGFAEARSFGLPGMAGDYKRLAGRAHLSMEAFDRSLTAFTEARLAFLEARVDAMARMSSLDRIEAQLMANRIRQAREEAASFLRGRLSGGARMEAIRSMLARKPFERPFPIHREREVTELQWTDACALLAHLATGPLAPRTLSSRVTLFLQRLALELSRPGLPPRLGHFDIKASVRRLMGMLSMDTPLGLASEREELLQGLTHAFALAREILSEANPHGFALRFLEGAIRLTGAMRGFLVRAGPEPVVLESRDLQSRVLATPAGHMSRTILKEVLGTGRTIRTDDAFHDERFATGVSIAELRLLSVLCVPLMLPTGERGAVYLDHPEIPARFGPTAERVLGELCLLVSAVSRRGAITPAGPAAAAIPALTGTSPGIERLRELIARIAPTDLPVLIRGESGSGKEVAARELHRRSTRSAGPFVTVACAALAEGLLEAELFGYAAGAFSGAERSHTGLLEASDGGTLFLDGVEEMSSGLQAKLLRVLETKRFRRIMDTSERSSDFRLAAATSADLEALVAEGGFRADLLFRLKVAELAVPALRERPDDVLMLAAEILRSEAGPLARLSPAATTALVAHSWPGNVRELSNEVKRASVLVGPDGIVHASMLSIPTAAAQRAPRRLLDEVSVREKELIQDALRRNGGHRDRTARELSISRRWLQKLIKLHGL